ncbi:MAG: type II toxin-antitoxin system HigB family toxin [Bacteroidetes bacterium]|nr:type II toxin-antitoxin system HigB family toxin [Bacteroidota bacterium]
MHIISRKRLLEFCKMYPDPTEPMDRWYRIVKHTNYNSFAELRKTFPQADQVGKFIVFNIGGNKYRLIAYIVFSEKRIYIRHVLTHAEYDKEEWKV